MPLPGPGSRAGRGTGRVAAHRARSEHQGQRGARRLGGCGQAADRSAGGRQVTTIPPPMFSFPLSSGEILVPRTPLITDAYHALLVANRARLARWEAWAIAAPVLAET